MPRWTQTEPERFWSKVDRGGPDECWLWRGGVSTNGYGNFYVSGRLVRAHRYAYETHYGPVAPELQVCHRCDNKPCCNPAHLFRGTKSDNMRDCAAKGRNASQRRPWRTTYYQQNVIKTHCPHGHAYDTANTRISPDGARRCRACEAANRTRRIAARAALRGGGE